MAIADELHDLGRYRIRRAIEIADKGTADGIAGSHLLAIGSRETHMRNIVGDGGHGRGWVQIDDRYHQDWLSKHEGCESGSWRTTGHNSALDPGHCPTFSDACWKAISLLRSARTYGKNRGVAEKDLTKFALSAYNAGAAGALRGYRDHGDSDHFTTGGDYAADVIARRRDVLAWLKANGYA